MKQENALWNPQEAWSSKEDLEWLALLSSDSKEALTAQEIELAANKADPWRWLTHWAVTEDAQNEENPFQPFPNKEHLFTLTKFWMDRKYLLVPKSRQLTATWLFVGLYLHDSMFWPSRNTLFQCKIENDADLNLQRARTIHQRLPRWMQEWQPMNYIFTEAVFPRSRSKIRAIPAGEKHFRQNTLTGAFVDEAVTTEGLDEVLAGAKSALGRVGRFTAISSAGPSYFADLVFDRV